MGTFLRQLFSQQRISNSFRNKLFQLGTVLTKLNVLATGQLLSLFVRSIYNMLALQSSSNRHYNGSLKQVRLTNSDTHVLWLSTESDKKLGASRDDGIRSVLITRMIG
jgi:hypothetical protein